MAGDVEAVRRLLTGPIDVNNRNRDNGWSVLMVAVTADHADIVAELVAWPGLDINARAEGDRTALHLAAEQADEGIVALLGRHPDIDPNAKDAIGRTPLLVAAFNGREGAVEELLDIPGIDPNLVDRDRQTALHWAALAGHVGVVRILLADARVNAGIANRPGGDTAYLVAAGAGQEAVADVLGKRMRTNPGTDELSPGDAPGKQADEAPEFFDEPFVPEPPDLREPE